MHLFNVYLSDCKEAIESLEMTLNHPPQIDIGFKHNNVADDVRTFIFYSSGHASVIVLNQDYS